MYSDKLFSLIEKGKKIEGIHFTTPFFWNLDSIILPENTDVIFENCTFDADFHITSLKLTEGVLKFSNCTFAKNFRIFKTQELFLIEFENSNFNRVILQDCECTGISIENSNITDSLVIVDCKCDELNVQGSENDKIINELCISSEDLVLTEITTNDSISKLILRGFQKLEITGNLNLLEIDTSSFNYLNYVNVTEKEFNTIQKLEISNHYLTGSILLEELIVEKCILDNVTCTSGSFRFNQLIIADADFANINISSFYWNQVDFKNELSIHGCNFNNLQFSNVSWPKGKKVSDSFLDEKIPLFYQWRKNNLKKVTQFDQEDLGNLRQERETYKQLKAAALSNHLNIEALDFYRNEMRLYWKEVRINGGIPWQNRILVFLNRWVSDFGQSWALPLLWLFTVHFILFMSIYNWQFSSASVDIKNGLGEFFQLLNPVHKTPDYINTGMGLFTEFWMRVLGGFFIYHFIKATRKYGKV